MNIPDLVGSKLCGVTGKVCIYERKIAKRRAKELRRKLGKYLRSYKCEYCGYFHMTKSMNRDDGFTYITVEKVCRIKDDKMELRINGVVVKVPLTQIDIPKGYRRGEENCRVGINTTFVRFSKLEEESDE